MLSSADCLKYLLLTSVVLLVAEESSCCNTHLIKHVYMLTCGRKKRYHPPQSEMAVMVRRMIQILGRQQPSMSPEQEKIKLNDMLGIENDWTSTTEGSKSTTVKPTTPFTFSFNGLSWAHSQWLAEHGEDHGEDGHGFNTVERREVSKLLESCCQVPPVGCTAKDFAGACK